MTRPIFFSPRVCCGALLLLLCLGALAQTWQYNAIKKGRGGETPVEGTLTLRESGGSATVTIQGPGGACHGRTWPAQVTRTDDAVTIEVTEVLTGCDAMRFVLRADGSGGYKEVRRGDAWVRSAMDHGLALKR